MKTSIKLFALLLSTLVVSGCGSCPCKKNAAETPVIPAPKVVAAPVVAKVAQQPVAVKVTPVAPKKNHIPAAVMK